MPSARIIVPDGHAYRGCDGPPAVFSTLVGLQRHLAEAAGNIEHIGRLREARQPRRAKLRISARPSSMPSRKCEVPRRQVGMMQVIGLDAVFDKAAHQLLQRLDIVIDAFAAAQTG